ncbi:Sec-independent protein translocase subunit TatA [Streptomyces sp. NPDC048507]|uniref:Sec-independent protein translocase subunit TatA n=1 Tax=Streptomyces sp. NPDC048507 TaxID=3365560 RepID=UPI003714B125
MLRNGLEPWHLIIVLVVCLLVFGSKKLPDMARSLGRSARILKSEARALRTEDAVPQGPADGVAGARDAAAAGGPAAQGAAARGPGA